MSLSIVKSGRVTGDEHDPEDESPHGCRVMKKLLSPWARFGPRIVCADSYFASVASAIEMFKLGFRFIGVVKTAHRAFPLKYLSNIPLAERGSMAALVSEVDGVEMAAFVWCDRERRYFISTVDSISAGQSYKRKRWRQVQPVESNVPPEMIDLEIAQPKGAEVYYDTCAAIDQHNRCRQDDLGLERCLRTPRWDMRVGMSLFGMMIVDTFRVFKLCTGSPMSQGVFYTCLGEALIENPYAFGLSNPPGPNSRRLSGGSTESDSTVSNIGTSGIGLHLTPVKRRVVYEDSRQSRKRKRLEQVRCRACNHKTTSVCSECLKNPMAQTATCGYCDPRNDRYCFRDHMMLSHGVSDLSSCS